MKHTQLIAVGISSCLMLWGAAYAAPEASAKESKGKINISLNVGAGQNNVRFTRSNCPASALSYLKKRDGGTLSYTFSVATVDGINCSVTLGNTEGSKSYAVLTFRNNNLYNKKTINTFVQAEKGYTARFAGSNNQQQLYIITSNN